MWMSAILEMKLKSKSIGLLMKTRFNGWSYGHNLLETYGGRILLLWKEEKVDLNIINIDAQTINVSIICKISSLYYLTSFVYGLYSIANRKTLWESVLSFGGNTSLPWLILGDFNSITYPDDRYNSSEVPNYETKNFLEWITSANVLEAHSLGCFYTWTNRTVWSRIDRVFFNGAWLDGLLESVADFLPSGCLSDHSSCVVSFLDYSINKRYPLIQVL
jgi:hypothetical protein